MFPGGGASHHTGGDPCIDANGVYHFTGEVGQHPGQSGQFSVIRWTAPTATTIDISALFTGRDPHPTSTDVHVLKNNVALFNDVINGFFSGAPGAPGASASAQKSYSVSGLSVAAGDTIDFAVGWGTNANWGFDSTGTQAIITTPAAAVPVPAAVWMFGSAVGVLGLVRRKLRG